MTSATDHSVPAAPAAALRHLLAVRGLDCPDEAAAVRSAVGPLPGVTGIEFDYAAGTACVTCAVGGATAAELSAAITAAGLPAEPVPEGAAPVAAGATDARPLLLVTAGAVALAVAGFACATWAARGIAAALHGGGDGLAARICYALAIALCWWRLLPRTWAALRSLRADMYVLMAIAVTGALILGDWLEAATVSILFLVALALERWSAGRARRAIAALFELAPTQARVADAQGERLVPASEIPAGTMILVQPGERLPLDGVVESGASSIVQAPITGESVPVVKARGDQVYAGTINAEGMLLVRTSGTAADTTLARMTRLVAQARQQRGRAERWVDRFAVVYTPIVVVTALAVAVGPPLLLGAGWGDWFYRALVLLVIACPCALVIATPVAVVAALARAARAGVLVKGGEHLEQIAQVRSLAVDKTGTLTTGRPSVAMVLPAPGQNERTLLDIAAALEARSDHPLARAIVTEARRRGFDVLPANDVQVVPGRGVLGTVAKTSFWLGSPRFASERGAEWRPPAEVFAGTTVLVGYAEQVLGSILITDTVRPEAGEALQDCRQLGVAPIVMLTGDSDASARAVGQALGIDQIHAGLLPLDKVERVAALAISAAPVALVGDGVNDAPALARADIGIAMGAAATPAALETADIALLGEDLGKLPWLIRHARRMRRIVRQNIAAALGAKAIFLILTLLGISSLWLAIAADAGMSVLVTLNALRLLQTPEPPTLIGKEPP